MPFIQLDTRYDKAEISIHAVDREMWYRFACIDHAHISKDNDWLSIDIQGIEFVLWKENKQDA